MLLSFFRFHLVLCWHWAAWVASHPVPSERQKQFERAAQKGADYRPALSEQDFGALKTMCDEDEDVEEFYF